MAARTKKAPCVDVKTDANKDQRFEVLGELAGYNRHEALGRMFSLWAWCVDRGLKDAPPESDGYVVSGPVLVRFLGPNGVNALLADGCDELALGSRWDDTRFYLRGTSEYVAARRARQESAVAGGNARADGPRSATGKFVGEGTIVQPELQLEATRTPADKPAGDQPHPAPSSSSSPSEKISDLSRHARTIPPSTVQAPAPTPTVQDASLEARRLAEITWARVSQARMAVAGELCLAHVLPLPAAGPTHGTQTFRDLRDRIREEGDLAAQVCDRVVEVLVAQARDTKSVEWLSEKAFTAGGWRNARERIPGWRKPLERAGPKSAIGAASPRTDHPESTEPVPFGDMLP